MAVHSSSRFPIKDKNILQQWEHVVQTVRNDGKQWRATRHSYICSNHFEKCDYIMLPCSEKTCRLKKNAVPSLFKILPPSWPNHNIPDEARSRLEIPEQRWSPKRHARKRHLTDEEISVPAAKIFGDHTMQNQKIKCIYHLKSKIQKSQIRN